MIAIGAFTRSSSFRVGALFTTLSSAGILFVFYFWSLADDDKLIDEAKAALSAERFFVEELYRQQGIDAVSTAIQNRILRQGNNTFICLMDTKKNIIAGNFISPPLLSSQALPAVIPLPLKDFIAADSLNNSYQSSSSVLMDSVSLGDFQVIIARNVDDLYSTQKIGRALGWIFVVMLAMIAALSFGVAIYVVNRINRMSHTASDIMDTGDLSARMEIDSSWDDLSKLAIVFNKTLERIESSVKNIKQVSDNIAHDLRTPLSRLRSRLEKLPESELRDQALDEADNLLAIFNSLLRIADVESERQRSGFSDVALHDVITDVIDLYEPLVEEKNIALTSHIEPVNIEGDPHLFFQALSNLLDNALKYSKGNCQIEVILKNVGPRIIIGVYDSGPGLPTQEFNDLDRRFYRSEQSRTSPGNGLGLSMVKAVATIHYGKLWFIDNPLRTKSGFGVVISLPSRKYKKMEKQSIDTTASA